jgi:hypothetical protein
VDQNQALRFAIDIARGVEFLHSLEPMIPDLLITSKHIMVILYEGTVSYQSFFSNIYIFF